MKRLGMFLLMLLLAAVTTVQAGEMVPDGAVDIAGGEGTAFALETVAVSVNTGVTMRGLLEGDATDLTFHIESISGPGTAEITFSGLTPSAAYYLYVDNLHSARVVDSDATGQLTLTQDLTEPHLIILKDHPNTVFISSTPWTDAAGVPHPAGWSHSDGTDLNGVMGSWDPATLTATFLGDASEPIQVLSSDVTVDGAGHTLQNQGSYSNLGIYVYQVHRVTIKNLTLIGWINGVHTRYSNYNNIANNTFMQNGRGYHLFAGSQNRFTDNVVNNSGYALFVSIYSSGNVFDGNTVSDNSIGLYVMGMTSSNTYSNNVFDGSRDKAFYWNNTHYNKIFGNTISNTRQGANMSGYNNQVYNNNFLNVTDVALLANAGGTTFNQAAPLGGNFYSDLTGPDADGDGFVDTPRYISGGIYDNLPHVRMNGWIDNQAPIFAEVGAIEAIEYDQINLTLDVTDPDGDAIAAVYAQNLPAGATFDAATRQFSWRPDGTQAGVYVISFFADDAVNPPATGQLDVVITVGEMVSPTDMAGTIINEIAAIELLPEVQSSYTANLQNAEAMIEQGNITAVTNQYEVIIHKIDMDLKQGKITQEAAATLKMMANDAIALLNP